MEKKKTIYMTLALFSILVFSVPALSQGKMPVKIEALNPPNDVVGKRLVYLVNQGIQVSSRLKPAGEESAILICNILTTKIHGRPSSAYSYITYINRYGKIGPVLGHHLGICSNLTVQDAARRIIDTLQANAEKKFNNLRRSEK